MPAHRIKVAPDRIAEGKQLYELTQTPVDDIAALLGLSPRTLERRIAEWGWTPRSAPRHVTDRASVAAAPVNKAAADTDAGNPHLPEARIALAARIHKTVERGLDAVERVLGKVDPADPSEAERSARTLAAVARTLHEIAAFTKPDEMTPPDEADDDPVPQDIDEFRRELTRRIRGFIERRRAGAGGVSAAPEESLE